MIVHNRDAVGMEDDFGVLESQLVDAVEESLAQGLASNATFLAERLVAERDCEESRALLADCYMAESKHYKVVVLLKDARSEMCRYKFALSCVKVSKFKEAEKALLGGGDSRTARNVEAMPNGSYGFYLLAVVMERLQRYADAKEYYMKSLELNPTLWTAYEQLVRLGDGPAAIKVFSEAKMRLYEQSGKKGKRRKEEGRGRVEERRVMDEGRRTQGNLCRRRSQVQGHRNMDLMGLLRRFGEGHFQLCQFNCEEAIEELKKLPASQQNTGWVLCTMARAHMEMVRYSEAAALFEQAFQCEPQRLEGVEYYSSCLWHLKKQVDLCHLAHQALEKSLYAPYTWIAVGNCYSLQKDHEQALRFFSRAIFLNPHNPYAYTLCGHEHAYNEEFPKAKKMFDNALMLDVRNYSAWWGLGNLHFKQEKYDRAAESFKRAIDINQRNPVLHTFMGMNQAANHDFLQALKSFEKSEKIDPRNGLNKFQKANTLVKLERYDQAVAELEALQTLMPKESPIPMLLGKIHKKLGKIDKAHYYLSIAVDLQSKDAQKIKGFIEGLHSAPNEPDDIDH